MRLSLGFLVNAVVGHDRPGHALIAIFNLNALVHRVGLEARDVLEAGGNAGRLRRRLVQYTDLLAGALLPKMVGHGPA